MIIKKNISGEKPLNYLRSQLDKSGKTLANCLKEINLEEGKVYAFVPENVSENNLFEFERGGLYPQGEKIFQKNSYLIPVRNDARDLIIKHIYKYLNLGEDNCCFFEEPIAYPSDLWVKKSGMEYVSIDNEMFYFFDNRNNDLEKITRSFKASENYYSLCIFSSHNEKTLNKFNPFEKITPALINELTNNITSFIVGAYDGEGYLVWEK